MDTGLKQFPDLMGGPSALCTGNVEDGDSKLEEPVRFSVPTRRDDSTLNLEDQVPKDGVHTMYTPSLCN
jgi:hypothetical protein